MYCSVKLLHKCTMFCTLYGIRMQRSEFVEYKRTLKASDYSSVPFLRFCNFSCSYLSILLLLVGEGRYRHYQINSFALFNWNWVYEHSNGNHKSFEWEEKKSWLDFALAAHYYYSPCEIETLFLLHTLSRKNYWNNGNAIIIKTSRRSSTVIKYV